MIGNGIANVIAAAILAAAIVWTGGFGGRASGPTEEDYAAWHARAVGDIRKDIVVNCECCGEASPRRGAGSSF